jgi:hypothetical protein
MMNQLLKVVTLRLQGQLRPDYFEIGHHHRNAKAEKPER